MFLSAKQTNWLRGLSCKKSWLSTKRISDTMFEILAVDKVYHFQYFENGSGKLWRDSAREEEIRKEAERLQEMHKSKINVIIANYRTEISKLSSRMQQTGADLTSEMMWEKMCCTTDLLNSGLMKDDIDKQIN